MSLDPTKLVPSALELTVAEAQVVVGLAAISSDGDVEDIELTALVAALNSFGILPELDEDQREDFVHRIIGLCDLEGISPLLGAALRTLPDHDARRLALALTVEILVSDGQIPNDELVYLQALKEVLGINDADFDEIIRADEA